MRGGTRAPEQTDVEGGLMCVKCVGCAGKFLGILCVSGMLLWSPLVRLRVGRKWMRVCLFIMHHCVSRVRL
jgi:uncharacterized iron-regulated membrane protein